MLQLQTNNRGHVVSSNCTQHRVRNSIHATALSKRWRATGQQHICVLPCCLKLSCCLLTFLGFALSLQALAEAQQTETIVGMLQQVLPVGLLSQLRLACLQ